LTKTRFYVPSKYKPSYSISRSIINLVTFSSDYYMIGSFLNLRDRILFKPPIRKKIMDLRPKQDDHILVYQTSKSNKKLLKILSNLKENFIVYGFNKSKKQANIVFKRFNENDFFQDLAGCKFVITNGGFSLIADALYLHKPILCQPVRYQFEQIFNAINVQKLGYGEFHEDIKKETVKNFISKLNIYRANLKNYKRYSNKELFEKLEEIISSNSQP
jgi:uncharacterized protein (TIGR00661 family)